MDLLAAPGAMLAFVTGKLVPFLFVLTIIVFFHELGHYLVARWNKVKVDAFSIGFGPEIFGFNDKNGTRWKFSVIPLGGYVKFFGDQDPASTPDREKLASMSADEREGAFEEKALWRKALVVVAGPVANFLLAIVIYSGVFMIHDDVVVEPVIGSVLEGSAAAEAGFKVGDRVVQLDGAKVSSFRHISEATMLSSGATLNFVVERDGQQIPITANPRITERVDRFGNKYNVAIRSDPVCQARDPARTEAFPW